MLILRFYFKIVSFGHFTLCVVAKWKFAFDKSAPEKLHLYNQALVKSASVQLEPEKFDLLREALLKLQPEKLVFNAEISDISASEKLQFIN